jgi:hypothetical protein
MLRSTTDPFRISISLAVYRLLLHLYPRAFRQQYGPHMAQVFRDWSLNTLRHSGTPGLAWLWAITLFDLAKTAAEEHFQRITEMTRAKFIRLGGWGLSLGSLTLILAINIGSDNVRGFLYRQFGTPTTAESYNQFRLLSDLVPGFLTALALFMITAGILGYQARYGKSGSGLGNNSLKIAAGGAIIATLSALSFFFEFEAGWFLFINGIMLMLLGLGLFGLANRKERLMRRWNSLPILVGLPLPILYVVDQALTFAGSSLPFNEALSLAIFTFTTIGLILLGYHLQEDNTPEPAPASA